ncbi:MAG TPA: hypothetical protein VGM51_01970 [Armatimonadota bacterium]|jgi:hypothetical protein
MPIRPRTPLYDLIDRLIKLLSVVYTVLFLAIFFGLPLRTRLGIRLFNHPNDFLIYMAALFLMVIALFALHALRNQLRGDIFPTEPPREIRFREASASGRSFRSVFSRFGGASNCLEVTVTDDELWTRPGWPFRLIWTGRENGLENRIPLASISAVTHTGWRKRGRLLEYRDMSGGVGSLELRVRDVESFDRALQSGNPALTVTDK